MVCTSAPAAARVVDLHGRLDVVVCLGCGARTHPLGRAGGDGCRQRRAGGPRPRRRRTATPTSTRPSSQSFVPPRCDRCGGLLKPDVVFFGENVPLDRYDRARRLLAEADALLVAGSSLMVYSGFRFVRLAHDAGLSIAIVNRGRTRADDLAALKVEGEVGAALTDAVASLR